MTIGPQHIAIIRTETLISIAINALIPTAIIWAIGLAPPAQFLGLGQLLHGMSMASGLATCLMSLAVTLIVRGRIRRNHALATPIADLPGFARRLPRALPLRMLAMGLVAVVLLVPLGAAAVAALRLLPLGATEFIIFNIVYGTIVGLTMTPVVVLRAFADPVAAA